MDFMKKRIIILILVSLYLASCSKYVRYKYFTLENEILLPNKLMKAGFYYYEDIKEKNSSGKRYDVYFLYENGMIGRAGYFGKNIQEFYDSLSNSLTFRTSKKDYMDKFKSWGKYSINNKEILIQAFELYSEVKYAVYELNGSIKGNNSFVISSEGFSEKGINVLKTPYDFKFYPCDNCKPDSTNWLMKRK
jgi:hypothetical protein